MARSFLGWNNWHPDDTAPSEAPTVDSGGSSHAPDEANRAPQAIPETFASKHEKDWSRTAYYNSKDGVADNMVFLGNYGGKGTLRFDL
jgi:hypothetical protein